LHGDGRHRVSFDSVIKTMGQTGADMQSKHREPRRPSGEFCRVPKAGGRYDREPGPASQKIQAATSAWLRGQDHCQSCGDAFLIVERLVIATRWYLASVADNVSAVILVDYRSPSSSAFQAVWLALARD